VLCIRREGLHLMLGGGDGDGDIHDGAERAEHDAGEEELAEIDVLQVEHLEHACLLLGNACEVGKVDGEDGEDAGDEDAADGADDGTCRLYAAPVDDKLGGECDGGSDEKGPEQDVRRGEEDEGDEPLGNEDDGKQEDEERLRSCDAAEDDEECAEPDQEEEHRGQAVVVDDGVAAAFAAYDDVLALARVDVKGGIVHRLMREGCLCSLIWTGVNSDLHLVLRAARRKGGDAALNLLHTENLCLVGWRIAVLTGRQVKEEIEKRGDGEADGEESCKTLRMYLHGGLPFVACGNDQNYHIR